MVSNAESVDPHAVSSLGFLNNLLFVRYHTVSEHEDSLLTVPFHFKGVFHRVQNLSATIISIEFVQLLNCIFDVLLIVFDFVNTVNLHKIEI